LQSFGKRIPSVTSASRTSAANARRSDPTLSSANGSGRLRGSLLVVVEGELGKTDEGDGVGLAHGMHAQAVHHVRGVVEADDIGVSDECFFGGPRHRWWAGRLSAASACRAGRLRRSGNGEPWAQSRAGRASSSSHPHCNSAPRRPRDARVAECYRRLRSPSLEERRLVLPRSGQPYVGPAVRTRTRAGVGLVTRMFCQVRW
jgi:hypothetical protein